MGLRAVRLARAGADGGGRRAATPPIVRIPGTLKALALSTDGKGRFGQLDPYLGRGARGRRGRAQRRGHRAPGRSPITNCMNFGNPERPEVMWQFAESIRGMRDACLALDTPVTGGNVSFYNESGDSAIWPTPVIGMLGLLEDHRLRVPAGFAAAGPGGLPAGRDVPGARGVGVRRGRAGLDRRAARRRWTSRASASCTSCCQAAAREDLLASAHDCGDGGLAVALAESAIAGGARVRRRRAGRPAAARRAVLRVGVAGGGLAASRAGRGPARSSPARHGVPCTQLGETGGPRVVFDGLFETTVEELRDVFEAAIPRLLGEARGPRDRGGHVLRRRAGARSRRRPRRAAAGARDLRRTFHVAAGAGVVRDVRSADPAVPGSPGHPSDPRLSVLPCGGGAGRRRRRVPGDVPRRAPRLSAAARRRASGPMAAADRVAQGDRPSPCARAAGDPQRRPAGAAGRALGGVRRRAVVGRRGAPAAPADRGGAPARARPAVPRRSPS